MSDEPSDSKKELHDAIQNVSEWNNAFGKGINETLVGRTVVAASGEVWSGGGEWSISITFDDGSTISVPGETLATGPLADIVRMGGGNPDGCDEDVFADEL